MAKRTVRTASGDPSHEVQAAIRRLRDAHALGKWLLAAYPIGETFGQGAMRREAEKRGVNTEVLYKARVFAHEKKGYTDKELDSLCQACRQHRRALGFAFITKFVTISDKRQRAAFQKRRWKSNGA